MGIFGFLKSVSRRVNFDQTFGLKELRSVQTAVLACAFHANLGVYFIMPGGYHADSPSGLLQCSNNVLEVINFRRYKVRILSWLESRSEIE